MTVIRLGWKVVNYLMLIKNVVLIKTRKGVSELRVSALASLSAIEKKSVYWSSSLESLKILNVQDIIRKELRRQVQIYPRRVFLPPPSPMLANIYSILAYDVPRTEAVGLPIKFRFNAGPALHPIADLMLVNRLRRWPNTNLSPGLLYTLRKHVAFSQCCFSF